MPTTTYTNTTIAANTLGARTDSVGAAVADLTAEESRLATALLAPGYLKPANAFVVAPQSSPNMTVKVGSGNAKADHYVIGGSLSGQGNYVLRLDVATQNVTVSAAEASQTRLDEIYLVVRDTAYDSSTLVLPQLAYRKGDPGGAVPGPDSSWRAYALLARVPVAAGATAISSVTDMRATAGISDGLFANLKQSFVTRPFALSAQDLFLGNSAQGVDRLPVGASGNMLRAQDGSVSWSDIGAPQHRYVHTNEGNNTTSPRDVGFTNGYDPVSGLNRGFSLSIPPARRYIIEAFIVFDSSGSGASGANKLIFNPSSGLVGFMSYVGPAEGQNASPWGTIDFRAVDMSGGTAITFVVGAGDYFTDAVHVQGMISNLGGSTGNFAIQYAANAGAQTAYVAAGSWMRVTRVL